MFFRDVTLIKHENTGPAFNGHTGEISSHKHSTSQPKIQPSNFEPDIIFGVYCHGISFDQLFYSVFL
jgi:hypothetical protein